MRGKQVYSSHVTKEARAMIAKAFEGDSNFPKKVTTKYPKQASALVTLKDGTIVRLLQSSKVQKWGTSKARLQALCSCGKWCSTGTINQHRVACVHAGLQSLDGIKIV